MDWSDEGIVLSMRPHGESGLVASLLTRAHGRHAGFVPGGGSRRARPMWQPGNLVEVEWRARLSEQLGNYSGELREPHAARALDDASELAGLSAACAMIDAALPEREPHPAIFDGFRAFLGALGHPGWPARHRNGSLRTKRPGRVMLCDMSRVRVLARGSRTRWRRHRLLMALAGCRLARWGLPGAASERGARGWAGDPDT